MDAGRQPSCGLKSCFNFRYLQEPAEVLRCRLNKHGEAFGVNLSHPTDVGPKWPSTMKSQSTACSINGAWRLVIEMAAE